MLISQELNYLEVDEVHEEMLNLRQRIGKEGPSNYGQGGAGW